MLSYLISCLDVWSFDRYKYSESGDMPVRDGLLQRWNEAALLPQGSYGAPLVHMQLLPSSRQFSSMYCMASSNFWLCDFCCLKTVLWWLFSQSGTVSSSLCHLVLFSLILVCVFLFFERVKQNLCCVSRYLFSVSYTLFRRDAASQKHTGNWAAAALVFRVYTGCIRSKSRYAVICSLAVLIAHYDWNARQKCVRCKQPVGGTLPKQLTDKFVVLRSQPIALKLWFCHKSIVSITIIFRDDLMSASVLSLKCISCRGKMPFSGMLFQPWITLSTH